MVNCAMMHGLAISLPESTLVQSPLRLSACAHTHIHTRIGMRAGSDARLAAAEAWAVTAGGHGISTAAGHIVEHLPHGELVQTRISKCGGSSDDIALTSPTRGWLSDGACVHLLCLPCPESPLQRSSRPSMPRVEIRCTRWTCPIGCVYAHGVWHVLDITGKPPKLSMETVLRRIPDCLRRH